MIPNIFKFAAVAAFALASSVSAENWTLDESASQLTFGSVKKDTIGESHSFSRLSGTVAGDGAVSLDIDLTTVETNIDVRNERITEHVFKGIKAATLSGEIDIDAVKSLAVGASTLVDMEGALSFLGASLDIETEMFVVRISDTQVLATTNDMIWISVEDAGITAGVDKLMELASLPGITRAFPVTARLMFNMDEKKAEVAPASSTGEQDGTQLTAAVAAGDAAAGKKVFRKCRSCHSVKEGKNGVGPSLYNVVGAEAGKAEGYRGYSNALQSAGVVWDSASLTAFLTKPRDYIPGTKMSFAGLKKEEDIVNLLAYLKSP